MELLDLYKASNIHKKILLDKNADMLSHAYILSSTDTYLIDNYSQFVVQDICCEGQNSPCMECLPCQKIMHGNMVDLSIYPKSDKSLVVEDISSIVVDSYIRPMDSLYKIYILKNFDSCTVQGQNKLLKTLEEPPNNVIFLLTCASEDLVLPTIRSRAKVLSEPMLNKDNMIKYLTARGIQNANILAELAGGNLTIAMQLSQKNNAGSIVDLAFNTLLGLSTSKDVLKYSSQILLLKKDIPFFLDIMTAILRDIITVGKGNINFSEYEGRLKELSKFYSPEMVRDISAHITQMYNKMDFNCNMTGLIDEMLLTILEVKFLWQK